MRFKMWHTYKYGEYGHVTVIGKDYSFEVGCRYVDLVIAWDNFKVDVIRKPVRRGLIDDIEYVILSEFLRVETGNTCFIVTADGKNFKPELEEA